MYKRFYSRFLGAAPGRLHFAAHSHHSWPDPARDAHIACFDDAARLADDKWELVFGSILPEAQLHAAKILSLSDPKRLAFAPNTHEFVVRLFSCLNFSKPVRILMTGSEFHSFSRQMARLEEIPSVSVERIPVEPFESFQKRFEAAAACGGHELVFLSQVFFDSGFKVPDIQRIVSAVPDSKTLIIIDGYHAFCAFPVDLSPIQDRAFYLAGGYKYAQAGEGVCLLHVPPSADSLRPAATGWFSDFSSLEGDKGGGVSYGNGGFRFMGSTFDPSGLYRFNGVMRWRESLGLTIDKSDAFVRELQRCFIERLPDNGDISRKNLLFSDLSRCGHFLTFRLEKAADACERLKEKGIVTDRRGDRLRFGFGLYHDEEDVNELIRRLV